MEQNNDLSIYSFTYPGKKIENEIFVDSKIREIFQDFISGDEKILITGPRGSGKTVLLTQFVSMHKDRCFSYFFSDDYWILRPTAFLLSLIKQMSVYLGIPTFVDDQENITLDLEKQKRIFETLTQRVFEKIKKEKTNCFFVIDGFDKVIIDNLFESFREIINLPTNSIGLFLLGSINDCDYDKIPFVFKKEKPHYFSLVETEKYFEGEQLEKSDIEKLQNWSIGMPGLLLLSKELIKSGQATVDEITNEQSKIKKVIDLQWDKINKDFSEDQKRIIALISFSITPLNKATISKILEINEDVISSTFSSNGFVSKDSNDCFYFSIDFYKNYAQNKYSNWKEQIIDRLIKFYEDKKDRDSQDLLSEYYFIGEKNQKIKNLITPEYLTDSIFAQNDISAIFPKLNESLSLACKNKDISAIYYELANSQIHEISNQLFGLSEVNALISLGDHDSALEFAYSTRLKTTRIRLLSKIFHSMEETGKTIPRESIEQVILEIHSLNLDRLDPETIIQTAADVFPLLPDEAINLVDRAKIKEDDTSPLELFALLTTVQSEDPKNSNLLTKIETEEIRDFAITHSPWLARITASEVIQKSQELQSTKAKEYLLRQWCLQNKNSLGLSNVLEITLDTIISDSQYRVSLRNLRQLSGMIKYCETEKQEYVSKRFEAPMFQSIQSPIEEKVRLNLNLVESLWGKDQVLAEEKINEINDFILTTIMDNDIKCFCLSQLFGTITRINSPKFGILVGQIKTKLEDEFISILKTSASQLEISKNILRTLATVDLDLALAFSSMLNTSERRDIGLMEVLDAYSDINFANLDCKKILSTLDKFEDSKILEQTSSKIISGIKSNNHFSKDIIEFLLELITRVTDPTEKAKSLTNILAFSENYVNENQIFEKLIFTLEQIDLIWIRIECSFDMVSILAENHKEFALQIFEKTRDLSRCSSLSNQTIGIMEYKNLEKATQLFGELDDSEESIKYKENLLQLIDRFPSKIAQLRFFSKNANSLYKNGKINETKKIVQEQILPGLQNYNITELSSSHFVDIGLSLFDYSPLVAKEWIDKLSYSSRNICWYKISYRLITNSYFTNIYEGDPRIASIDIDVINKLLQIIDYIERDHEIYMTMRLITRAISCSNCRNILDPQKINTLIKLENNISSRLPDQKNITHIGYLLLCLGEIEKSRANINNNQKQMANKNFQKLIQRINEVDIVADKVLVLAELGVLVSSINNENANKLIQSALELVKQIQNVKDRMSRLEIITESFKSIRNSTKATEALKLSSNLAESINGVEKDKILESIIQTAYELDENIASELSEKIEDHSLTFSLAIRKKANELSKSPQKIESLDYEEFSKEILNEAAFKMNQAISSKKAASFSHGVLLSWLIKCKHFGFSEINEVIDWVIDSWIIQSAKSEISKNSFEIFSAIIKVSNLLLILSTNMSSLISIPEDMKKSFPGYSLTKKYYKVGERQKIIDFINSWIKENIKKNIIICDPYFDSEQLWILKIIPNNINVRILCNGEKFKLNKEFNNPNTEAQRNYIKDEKRRIKREVLEKWKEISKQDPPNTLIIINNTIFGNDEIHDRFLLTEESGLSIGSSLNGFGKKEFTITILSKPEVDYISSEINPKLRIDTNFSEVIFFDLE